jgi:nicotinamide riboside kinase
MIVINLIGEPSVGKTTTAAGVFFELSSKGYNVQMVLEEAKKYIFEDNLKIFDQQILLLAEQNRALTRLKDNTDIVITDSPLIMPIVYQKGEYLKSFRNLAFEQFNEYNNFNIFLKRKHKFSNNGRYHTEKDSISVRDKIIQILDEENIKFLPLTTGKKIHKKIARIVMDLVKK